MKNQENFSPHEGRVKIPVRFAKDVNLSKSHLVRVNQGKRNLTVAAAAEIVELFKAKGVEVHIFQLIPRLKKFKPYFCQGCPCLKR